MSKWVWALPFGILVVLSGLFFVNSDKDPNRLPSALIGSSLPVLSGASLEGEPFSMEVLPKGKFMLINVWATWCPTCKAEHDFLNKLKLETDLYMFGVNYKDDRQKAQAWLDVLGNPYDWVLFDPNGRNGLELGVYGAPETFLIDAKGNVLIRHAGDLNETVWQESFLPLMQKEQTP